MSSPPVSLHAIVDRLEDTVLFDREECPFHFDAHKGSPNSRVLLITGANATGKSLLFKHVAALAHEMKLHVITISIRERTGAGSFDMAGMRRTMMFGDEEEQSTGQTSYSVTKRGFGNVHSRLEQNPSDKPTLLLLDEPEMGLSEGYTAAMGQFLAEQVNSLPAVAPGVVVVTHSKTLVQEMLTKVEGPIHFIHTGADMDLATWLSSTEARTVEDLEQLSELAHHGRRAWASFARGLKEKKQAKAANMKAPDPTEDEDTGPRKAKPSSAGPRKKRS